MTLGNNLIAAVFSYNTLQLEMHNIQNLKQRLSGPDIQLQNCWEKP